MYLHIINEAKFGFKKREAHMKRSIFSIFMALVLTFAFLPDMSWAKGGARGGGFSGGGMRMSSPMRASKPYTSSTRTYSSSRPDDTSTDLMSPVNPLSPLNPWNQSNRFSSTGDDEEKNGGKRGK